MRELNETHWMNAQRVFYAATGISYFERSEPVNRAVAELLVDGATGSNAYKPTESELEAAVKYSNKFFTDGRSYNVSTAVGDRRFALVASMLASLGRGGDTADTAALKQENAALKATLAERDAKLAAIKAAGGW